MAVLWAHLGTTGICPQASGSLSRKRRSRQKQWGLPYQRTDRFVERQAEAVAAQGQYQLLTLLQKSELAIVLLCSGPTSIRTKDSDPDNSKGVGSVLQSMSHHAKTKFSLPGQRKTAGRRKIIANSQWAKLSGIGPERGYWRGPLTPTQRPQPTGTGRLPQAGNLVPRDHSLPSDQIRSGQERPALQAGYSGHSHSRIPSRAGSGCSTRYTPNLPCRGGEAKLGLSAYAQNSLPCPCAPRQARGRWHGKLSPYPCPIGDGFLAINLREI